MNEYEINEKTVAVIPVDSMWTKIMEENDEFLVNMSSMKIIERSCEYFGSSFLGRQRGTKSLIGINYKTPIIIEESKNIIYFPTTSPRLKECIWISLSHIKKYEEVGGKTLISFENNENLLINISYGSFDNQYLRAVKLESILLKRKKA